MKSGKETKARARRTIIILFVVVMMGSLTSLAVNTNCFFFHLFVQKSLPLFFTKTEEDALQ